jgi:hypothetical protein
MPHKEPLDESQARDFEQTLLDLARSSAAREEKELRAKQGRELNIQLRYIELEGEYPNTSLKIRRFHRSENREIDRSYEIYGDPNFFRDGAPLWSPERIVAHILMEARGG